MRCENKANKNVVLTFKRDELLYDVGNYSFVEGDIIETDNDHIRHQIQDIVQYGNVDRVNRILSIAHSECVEFLYPYSKTPIEDNTSMDDTMVVPDEYHINLSLPFDFSQTTLNLIKEQIHEYLVCRVLADWMSITNPQSKARWEEKAQIIISKIKTSLARRRGAIRRPLNPF